MQRTLKFRVWDGSTEQWINGVDFNPNAATHIGFEIFKICRYPHRDIIFQQFSGFKDVNGKEIYEGDLVNFCAMDEQERKDYQNIEVWFDVDCGEWSFGRFESGYDWSFCWHQIREVEVVGNIFQNDRA